MFDLELRREGREEERGRRREGGRSNLLRCTECVDVSVNEYIFSLAELLPGD